MMAFPSPYGYFPQEKLDVLIFALCPLHCYFHYVAVAADSAEGWCDGVPDYGDLLLGLFGVNLLGVMAPETFANPRVVDYFRVLGAFEGIC